MGFMVMRGGGRTGAVVLLEGNRPDKTLMLRADMNALSVQEENDVIRVYNIVACSFCLLYSLLKLVQKSVHIN